MKLLKTFNLNATKTFIAVCIIVALLWSVPYFLPTDPTTISANPAGWEFSPYSFGASTAPSPQLNTGPFVDWECAHSSG